MTRATILRSTPTRCLLETGNLGPPSKVSLILLINTLTQKVYSKYNQLSAPHPSVVAACVYIGWCSLQAELSAWANTLFAMVCNFLSYAMSLSLHPFSFITTTYINP